MKSQQNRIELVTRPETNQRLRALKGLRMVLSSADDADEDEPMVVEVDGTKIDTSNEWLLQKLPGLPCFTEFYPQLSHQVWPITSKTTFYNEQPRKIFKKPLFPKILKISLNQG